MGHKNGSRKRKKSNAPTLTAEEEKNTPKSFVFKRGKTGRSVQQLVHDMREVMQPNCAIKLKESKKNQLKDFLSVAPTLGVSHFLVFTQTPMGTYMRLARIPHGPTLLFRVMEYSLMKDVINIQKKPHSPGVEFKYSPLVILNNFSANLTSGNDHVRLMSTMFTNMFPPIDVKSVKLNSCRRALLLNREVGDKGEEIITMRHYFIHASPVGLNRPIKKLIKGKIPNLHALKEISDYVDRGAGGAESSDSEAEDTPETRIDLPQSLPGRGNRKAQKSAIRVKELGPRLKLQLIKVEEEFCGGKVLFHQYVHKSKEEVKQLTEKKAVLLSQKEQRKKEQEANIERKTKKSDKEQEEEDTKEEASEQNELLNDDDDDDEDSHEIEEHDHDDTEPQQKKGKRPEFTDADDVDAQLLGPSSKFGKSEKKKKRAAV
eukprot:TRINITY_DN57_c0_g1_i2.p1 TRINITY_DN57_c0_g1~~TRINITY_DN57_c0_g1_i2.p1  ORF type:complete len:430 (-),score=89.00 TRINITY_DN57_c0_g1_i2:341-1630(-)